MGNQVTCIKKIGFQDVQYIIRNNNQNYILISTLKKEQQGCLIPTTLQADKEEAVINGYLKAGKPSIVIYGKNTNDETVCQKYKQLLTLGFPQIYIYPGGMFEWLCLQDIYGPDEFPTTKKELDILLFAPRSVFTGIPLLTA